MAWNRKQTENLIRIYKDYPLLYKATPKAHEQKKRDAAYLEIAYKMQKTRPGTTVEEIKSLIRRLRTQYFKEQKKTSQGIPKSDVTKLWCYDNLKYLDEVAENELRLKHDTESMKLEAREYGAQNTEYDSMDKTETFCSEQYLDHQFNTEQDPDSFIHQDDDLLSNVDYENVEEDLNADFADTIEASYPAKRFRADRKMSEKSSAKLEHFVENPVKSLKETCEDGNLSESLAVKINETLDKANVILSKLSYTKESHNRPFIENLLLDLNRLPENAQRTIKWKITEIVYKAYQEQNRINGTLNS